MPSNLRDIRSLNTSSSVPYLPRATSANSSHSFHSLQGSPSISSLHTPTHNPHVNNYIGGTLKVTNSARGAPKNPSKLHALPPLSQAQPFGPDGVATPEVKTLHPHLLGAPISTSSSAQSSSRSRSSKSNKSSTRLGGKSARMGNDVILKLRPTGKAGPMSVAIDQPIPSDMPTTPEYETTYNQQQPLMTPIKTHPSTQKEPEELFDELLNIKHQYRDASQENLKLRAYIQRMEHKQRLYDKQMTEMLVSQATQIHLLQRQYGLKQDTNVTVTNETEQSEIDAFRSIIEQQQEKVKNLDITLSHRQDELQQVRAELAHAKACARYTKFEKIRKQLNQYMDEVTKLQHRIILVQRQNKHHFTIAPGLSMEIHDVQQIQYLQRELNHYQERIIDLTERDKGQKQQIQILGERVIAERQAKQELHNRLAASDRPAAAALAEAQKEIESLREQITNLQSQLNDTSYQQQQQQQESSNNNYNYDYENDFDVPPPGIAPLNMPIDMQQVIPQVAPVTSRTHRSPRTHRGTHAIDSETQTSDEDRWVGTVITASHAVMVDPYLISSDHVVEVAHTFPPAPAAEVDGGPSPYFSADMPIWIPELEMVASQQDEFSTETPRTGVSFQPQAETIPSDVQSSSDSYTPFNDDTTAITSTPAVASVPNDEEFSSEDPDAPPSEWGSNETFLPTDTTTHTTTDTTTDSTSINPASLPSPFDKTSDEQKEISMTRHEEESKEAEDVEDALMREAEQLIQPVV